MNFQPKQQECMFSENRKEEKNKRSSKYMTRVNFSCIEMSNAFIYVGTVAGKDFKYSEMFMRKPCKRQIS